MTDTALRHPGSTRRCITLHKHHGLGNDFLVWFADDLGPEAPSVDPAQLARRACDRRRGVGADGLLVAAELASGEPVMVLYNADGSRAEMSGNGIRCFAQAVARRTGAGDALVVRTDAGRRAVTMRATEDPDTIDVRVAMGPVSAVPEPDGWSRTRCHPDRPVLHLSVGNPHSVVGVDDVAAVDLGALGALVPHVNLEIVEPGPGVDEVTMRVHERGAGITAACGTGACASAYAARAWGLVPAGAPAIVVHMDGGSVRVELVDDGPATDAVLTGPATHVATVEIAVGGSATNTRGDR